MPFFRGSLGLLIFCFYSATAFSQTRPAKPDTAAAKPYTYTETMPVFPGGQSRLLALVRDSLRYPPQALRDGVQGKVVMSFTVDETGAFTKLAVKQGLRADLDAEATRLLRQLAPIRWQPGTQNGRPVAVVYTVPVTFSLKTELQPLLPDSLDMAPGKAIVLPTPSWRGGRATLPADRGVIYGSCVQRLGFSSGGLAQYVRLHNLTTHKVVRILVKPVMRSRAENEFRVALPPGRYALYSYEYSYGVEQVRKPRNSTAVADTRYTFEVRAGQLHYVGTWDFRQPFEPRFTPDKAALDQLLQPDNPGLSLPQAVMTLPK